MGCCILPSLKKKTLPWKETECTSDVGFKRFVIAHPQIWNNWFVGKPCSPHSHWYTVWIPLLSSRRKHCPDIHTPTYVQRSGEQWHFMHFIPRYSDIYMNTRAIKYNFHFLGDLLHDCISVQTFECLPMCAYALTNHLVFPIGGLSLAVTASSGTLALTFHPDCLCQSNSSSSTKRLWLQPPPTPHLSSL